MKGLSGWEILKEAPSSGVGIQMKYTQLCQHDNQALLRWHKTELVVIRLQEILWAH
jgi:hypothetical protein